MVVRVIVFIWLLKKQQKTLLYQFDEILVDLFYYLEKAAKRKQFLGSARFHNMNDIETQRILKMVIDECLPQ